MTTSFLDLLSMDTAMNGEPLVIGPSPASGLAGLDIAVDGVPFCVNLVTVYEMTLEGGVFAITGTAVDLFHDKIMAAENGTFDIVGADATLTTVMEMAAEGAAFTLGGSDVELYTARQLDAGGGTYLIAGTDTELLNMRLIEVEAGAFIYTGQDIELIYDMNDAEGFFMEARLPNPVEIEVSMPIATLDVYIPTPSLNISLGSREAA